MGLRCTASESRGDTTTILKMVAQRLELPCLLLRKAVMDVSFTTLASTKRRWRMNISLLVDRCIYYNWYEGRFSSGTNYRTVLCLVI